MIQKFKKKHFEIEAIQYNGHNDFEIGKWSNNLIFPSPVLEPDEENPSGSYLQIKTSDGFKTAIVGDWIIKDGSGEFYSSKYDTFMLSHDKIESKDVIRNSSSGSLPEGWLDWNALSLEQMVSYLRQKHMLSSSGDAKCIYSLIEFYDKHK